MNKGKEAADLKKYRKGSFTVEAVVVMGVSFLGIGLILFLCAFVHGRACMTACAYEQACSGKEQDTVGLFGIENVKKTAVFDENRRQVTICGECAGGWSGFRKEIRAEAERTRQKPVTWIRKMQAFREAADQILPENTGKESKTWN